MKKEYITIPNFITSLRLLGAIIILFLQPFTLSFYIIYGLSGFTDAIDGFVARKLKQVSEFGTKLDSVVDLCFYIVLAIKIMPTLIQRLPSFIWHIVTIIVLLRICIYLYGAIKQKHFVSNHTYLNKIAGALIYLLPFVMLSKYTIEYSYLIAFIAFIGAIQEFNNVCLKKICE